MATRKLTTAAAVLGVWCMVAGVAQAQEPAPPSDPPLEAPEPAAVPALVDLPESLRDGWGWVPAGPRRGLALSDVSVNPDDRNLIAVATLSGAVWLSVDGGGRWFQVRSGSGTGLGALSLDEELTHELQARLDELSDLPELDDIEIEVDEAQETDGFVDVDSLDEARAQVEEAAASAVEDVRSEYDTNPDLVRSALGDADQLRVTGGDVRAARPRVWIAEDERLFAGGPDGLFVSNDLGDNWREVIDFPVTALAWLPARDLWVAGTADGVRFSTDGVAWIDVDDATEGLYIYDLVSAPEGMYAGTSAGLWFAPDAQSWRSVGTLGTDVLTVLPDPDWDRGLWLSADGTIYRSDDGGERSRAPFGAPLPDVLDLLWLGPGRLLAASADGTWESRDGGTSWDPIVRGISDPDTRGLALADGAVLMVSDEGLFRLDELEADDEAVAVQAFEPPPWVPVGELIGVSLGRAGLASTGSAFTGRWGTTLMPTFLLEGRYRTAADLGYRPVFGTDDDIGGEWLVLARFTWTPDGRKTTDVIDVVITDDDIIVDDGRDRAVVTSAMNRKATTYRGQLAASVSELYFARAELVAAVPRLERESLDYRVEHQIRIMELEARLDVLTDGAVSRWAASAETSEE